MATVELTKDNLESMINDSDILLIDFWAEWCGPCRMFGPIFEKVSEEHPDITFAKCDSDKHQEVAGMFGIRSIPTLAIFREQILIFMQPGALPEGALRELIEQVKKVDMADVRAKMAEEEAKQKKDDGESVS